MIGLKNYYAVVPTPLSDAFDGKAAGAQNEIDIGCLFSDVMSSHAQLERDVMTLALRLYGESNDTFAPETIECMDRWRPVVEQMLEGY
jgi:hypothetical protein